MRNSMTTEAEENVSLGELITMFRNFLHETQEEFVRGTGYDAKTLSKYENDERMPSLEFLLTIARVKNINPNYFFSTKFGKIVKLSLQVSGGKKKRG